MICKFPVFMKLNFVNFFIRHENRKMIRFVYFARDNKRFNFNWLKFH